MSQTILGSVDLAEAAETCTNSARLLHERCASFRKKRVSTAETCVQPKSVQNHWRRENEWWDNSCKKLCRNSCHNFDVNGKIPCFRCCRNLQDSANMLVFERGRHFLLQRWQNNTRCRSNHVLTLHTVMTIKRRIAMQCKGRQVDGKALHADRFFF